MMKRLFLTVVAIACLMLSGQAAPAPLSSPDYLTSALDKMGYKTPEERLDYLIPLLNKAYEGLGYDINVHKSNYGNAVVLLVNGDKLGFDASAVSPNLVEPMKGVFVSSMFNNGDDSEGIALFLNTVADTGRNLEVVMYNGTDSSNGITMLFTPAELRKAIKDNGGNVDVEAVHGGGEDDEGLDSEQALKEIINEMEAAFVAEPSLDAHIWIDPQANRVVFSMTSDEFATMKEYRSMIPMLKSLFMKSFLGEGEENVMLLSLVALTGRGMQFNLYTPDDKNDAIVVDYSAEELMDALSDD